MATTTTAPERASDTTERAAPTLVPRVDIYETEAEFVILADMPGVTSDTVEVLNEADTLVVRGRAERPATDPEHQEFELGDYRRVFLITEDLDADRITARLTDGVLRVQIPKSDRLKPKKIPVQAE